MRKRLSKNGGYTLIELIIVVAILGILGAVLAVNVNTGTTARARGCAEEINALLSRCRVEGMSRAGEVRLSIEESEGVLTGVITAYNGGASAELESRVLGKSSLQISPLPLIIGFDRSTGAMRFFDADGKTTTPVTSITVSGGGSEFTVILVPSTGLHYLEDKIDG